MLALNKKLLNINTSNKKKTVLDQNWKQSLRTNYKNVCFAEVISCLAVETTL